MENNLNKLNASELHAKAEELREDDKLHDALQYVTLAIARYQDNDNYSGVVDALQSRVLCWKHLFLLDRNSVFGILARKDAEASLEVAEKYGVDTRIYSCYFRLGEVDMLFEDYLSASKNYEKALKYYKGSLSEKGDYRYHFGEALYRNGDKVEGKRTMLEGLKEIREGANDVDSFLIHVWESGANMRLAELLYKDEPEESKAHFVQAERIIQSDDNLVIRKRQLAELGKKLGY